MTAANQEPVLSLDEGGWCDHALRTPSPNCDARPDGMEISLLVVHNISLPAGNYGSTHVSDLFCNQLDYNADPGFEELRGLRVSSHFFIRRDGQLVQFVPTIARAWHAGLSSFAGRDKCNDFSIGIEMEGCDTDGYTDAQYDALCQLTVALQERHPLTDVAGHQHIAPGRKTDPGPHFDWMRYRAMLISAWPRSLAHRQLHFTV